MPRPFFGRCRAPSTCKAGKDWLGQSFGLPRGPAVQWSSAPSAGPQGHCPLSLSNQQGPKSLCGKNSSFSFHHKFQVSFCNLFHMRSMYILTQKI